MSARSDIAPAPARRQLALPAVAVRVAEANGVLVAALTAFAVVMVLSLRHGLVVDGWLALVSGREVAQHGLPSHDTLTIWAHGRRWTDQQWLAQLAFYGLFRAGGVKLALFVHALLGAGAITIAAVAARRLGASARSVTWVVIPAVVAFYPEASVLRPQSFAYPLFAGVVWLLAADARRPSRRVLLVLPLLVLWANLHGAALLGAGLVSLAGLAAVADALVRRPRRRPRRLALLLVVAPWPCLLASPYALHLPAYYEQILVGGKFSHFVTEWAPTTLTPATAPVYLLVVAGAWLLGRAGSRATTFERAALVATSALAFEAVRNTAWIGLVAVIVLPRLIDEVRGSIPEEPRRLNRLVAVAVLGLLVVTSVGVAAKPSGWFTGAFPAPAADAAAAGGPQAKVFAMSQDADWVLWRRPDLRGRVAFDARYELFTGGDVSTLATVQSRRAGWRRDLAGYRTFVLGTHDDAGLRDALVEARIARVVYSDANVVVLRR